MSKVFRAYYVWPKFPSVSMSGNACMLSCKHCNHTYLADMQQLTKPADLFAAARRFASEGAIGLLLSGGCDDHGEMLNLRRLLPTIRKIKDETELVIKLHTGLVDRTLAEEIVSAGVDIASTEVVGDNETIQDIFDFSASVESYRNTLVYLEDAGMPFIVPHVCIGLRYGKVRGERTALQIIHNSCDPELLVMIVFRPTKGTALENTPPPASQSVAKVIGMAKNMFPDKEISLGCIRPRNQHRQEIESAALNAGVSRMEIPSKKTLQLAQSMGYTIKHVDGCCALPQSLEP